MASGRADSLQGALSLLVLKTLAFGEMHGYAITQHIQRASQEALRVEEGSLYPALHRMEQTGWIASQWKLTETNRRARFYSLTEEGRRQLEAEEQNWARLTTAVAQVLAWS
ncbi:MAG: PadR family transcriptional regulator [Acidobacteria bacterium]|nr:PadR family transcriptional regulator [Acidobacteriota bacterium]